jgi:peptidoglycan hydrolase CwlO-like protein
MRVNPFNNEAGSAAARLTAAVALLAAVCALVVLLDGRAANASVASKQAALSDVRDRQDALSAQIADDNAQINALIGQVSEARQREEAAAAELAKAEQELDAAEADLEKGREHLRKVRAELKDAIAQLRQIVVGVYKSDNPDTMRLILDSANWEDAGIDAAYLDRVKDYQSETVQRVRDLRDEAETTVEKLADAKQRIEDQRDAIAQRRQELADVRASLEAQEQQLASARASRRDTLASLDTRASDLQDGIQKAQQRAERQAASVPPPISDPSDPSVAAPAPSAPAPSGSTATLNSDGSATPPADAPPAVVSVIEAANQIKDAPYVWGGGHGSFESSGYDCSGAVSYALHGGGFLSSPLDSTGLGYWGESGEGNWITVYANSGHAWMVVAGLRWDTSDTGGDGPSWSTEMSSWEQGQSWSVRHPAGY